MYLIMNISGVHQNCTMQSITPVQVGYLNPVRYQSFRPLLTKVQGGLLLYALGMGKGELGMVQDFFSSRKSLRFWRSGLAGTFRKAYKISLMTLEY
jgi:hypothetical protein